MNDKCISCKSDDCVPFLTAKDRYHKEETHTYFICRRCNLVFLKDRQDNKNFIAYNLKKPSKAQKLVMQLFLLRFKNVAHGGKVLDYGAGAGNLARFLADNGYDVDCFEVDTQSIEYIKKVQKLPVVALNGTGKYDAIILESVLEHVPQPRETLSQIAKLLKNDGSIFIGIPNINSVQARLFKDRWFHLDAPRHLTHFYKNSFQTIVHSTGLKIVREHYFNLHIDLTGWYWSINDKNTNLNSMALLIMLALFLPLVFITSLLKTSGYILYILKKNASS